MSESNKLAGAAERLANGKSGHSLTEKPGMLAHKAGRKWRDPELHSEILALYTRAIDAEALEGGKTYFALYRRALEHLYVGHVELAQSDLERLRAVGSPYAEGSLPIWIALAAGNKAEAKRHLDMVNEKNKAKGHPKNKLSDYEL